MRPHTRLDKAATTLAGLTLCLAASLPPFSHAYDVRPCTRLPGGICAVPGAFPTPNPEGTGGHAPPEYPALRPYTADSPHGKVYG